MMNFQLQKLNHAPSFLSQISSNKKGRDLKFQTNTYPSFLVSWASTTPNYYAHPNRNTLPPSLCFSANKRREHSKKMGPYRSSSTMAVLLFTIFTLSSALDMSIISYEDKNVVGESKSSWRTDEEAMSIYEGWLAKHGKAYNRLGEKKRRFQISKNFLRHTHQHTTLQRSSQKHQFLLQKEQTTHQAAQTVQ